MSEVPTTAGLFGDMVLEKDPGPNKTRLFTCEDLSVGAVMIIVADDLEVSYINRFWNDTVQITIKRKKA